MAVALFRRTDDRSIRDLFEAAAPPQDVTYEVLRAAVEEQVRRNPAVVEAWQTYSYDKRGTPSHYLDGTEVGFYDGAVQDVIRHANPVDACVDFICREAQRVLRRHRGE